jgi:hypothetical protein
MTFDEEKTEDLREASGAMGSENRLVCLLYLLMRDYVTPGEMEEMVRETEKHKSYNFSNGWLAKYAIHLQGRVENKFKNW